MDIKGRILQCLRPRRDGVLLRSDIRSLGSASRVSAALKFLGEQGLVEKVDRGVYAKPGRVAEAGKETLLAVARARAQEARQTRRTPRRRADQRPVLTPTAAFVQKLADDAGVRFTPSFADRWAGAVTRLAGDEVTDDTTDDLLVALTRSGKLSPAEMVKLVMSHHRDMKHV